MTGIIDPLERPCCFLAAATPPSRLIVSQNAILREVFASIRVGAAGKLRPTRAATLAFPSVSPPVYIRDCIRASTTTTTTTTRKVFPNGRGGEDKKEGKYHVVVKPNGMRVAIFTLVTLMER